jgi:NAD(P)-dependent dehydrogenase (short-subunit alcohol dehydrogenase family)
MPRTILITEGDSPLGGELARLLSARGVRVIVLQKGAGAVSPGNVRAPVALAWNRRSPVSARAAFLAAVNTGGTVDDVLILEPPAGPGVLLPDASSADVEKCLDDSKGPVFIAREALAHFLLRGSGVLCFVGGGAGGGPLQSVVRESFRGLASSLLPPDSHPGIIVNGFQPGGGGAETAEFAGFIDRTLEDKARKITGRWFTCPGRGGLFQTGGRRG